MRSSCIVVLHVASVNTVLQRFYVAGKNKTYLCLELFHQPTLMHNFLYSLTICLLHYYPRHVQSINMLIFRRKNSIHTASVIFSLCKRLPSTLVESGLLLCKFCCTRLLRCSCTILFWCSYTGKPVLLVLHYNLLRFV